MKGGKVMVTPYLNFNGNCKEAIEFYKEVFDVSEIKILTFKDANLDNKDLLDIITLNQVMFCEMLIKGSKINMSDGLQEKTQGHRISLVVECDSTQEVLHIAHCLSEDGKVLIEVGPQNFAAMFASIVDKYDISWQVICHNKE